MAQNDRLNLSGMWQTFRWLVLLPIAMFISAANDLRYYAWGQVTDAQLLTVFQGNVGEPGGRSIVVGYTFNDEATGNRFENDRLPHWWDKPNGQTVRIRYIPGSAGSSRVDGHYDFYWLFVLVILGITAAVVLAIFCCWHFASRIKLTTDTSDP